jgi:hypothetical protein
MSWPGSAELTSRSSSHVADDAIIGTRDTVDDVLVI